MERSRRRKVQPREPQNFDRNWRYRQEDDKGSEWTKVTNRKNKGRMERRRHFSDDPTIATYFVGNLPEETTANILWRLFEEFGDICDSFVAKKKTSQEIYFWIY